MKKILFAALAATALFASCAKDNNGNQPIEGESAKLVINVKAPALSRAQSSTAPAVTDDATISNYTVFVFDDLGVLEKRQDGTTASIEITGITTKATDVYVVANAGAGTTAVPSTVTSKARLEAWIGDLNANASQTSTRWAAGTNDAAFTFNASNEATTDATLKFISARITLNIIPMADYDNSKTDGSLILKNVSILNAGGATKLYGASLIPSAAELTAASYAGKKYYAGIDMNGMANEAADYSVVSFLKDDISTLDKGDFTGEYFYFYSFENNVCADSYEDDVPVEYFPSYHSYSRFDRDPKSYKRNIIQFIVPCSGKINLLNYHPSKLIISGGSGSNAGIIRGSVVFEFVNFSNDANGMEGIQRQFESAKEHVKKMTGYIQEEVDSYNNDLESKVRSTFEKRKQRILNRNNLMASLGLPLQMNDNVPATYSIPKPEMRKKIQMKPVVHEHGFQPEPSLGDSNYGEILKLINDVGKNFERHPNIYNDKDEEALRDHILMMLDPHFEMGGASGETFNKVGKTDILLRYDSSVVFVAECKFWHGEKGYLATIDQLLSYLTWRDTKAAVILFVKRKDFSAILEKIKTATENHSNYLGFVNTTDENWFNFRFHINGDRNREVKLAVLLYHIP